MNISAKVEYACVAVLALSVEHASGQPVPLRRIAEPHDIPSPFLVQILLQLKAAGLVRSVRGPNGGYRLAIEPEDISMGDVVRAIEGDLLRSEVETPADNSTQYVLAEAFRSLAELQTEYLDSVTFAQLGSQVRSSPEPMYYI